MELIRFHFGRIRCEFSTGPSKSVTKALFFRLIVAEEAPPDKLNLGEGSESQIGEKWRCNSKFIGKWQDLLRCFEICEFVSGSRAAVESGAVWVCVRSRPLWPE